MDVKKVKDGLPLNRLTSRVAQLSERIGLLQVKVAVVVVIATSLIMIYGVVMRYVFRQGVPFTFEMPSWLFLVIITLTLSCSQAQRRHPRVDLLVSRLPGKWQNLLNAFAYLVFFILCVIYLRAGITRLQHDWISVSETAGLPVAPVLIVLCIGLVTLMLQLLVDMGKEVAEFRR